MKDRVITLGRTCSLISDDPKEHIQAIRLERESGTVQIRVDLKNVDYLQYLTPVEAMKLSQALRALAIEALENVSPSL